MVTTRVVDREVAVTIVASELTSSAKIEDMNREAEVLFAKQKEIQAETEQQISKLKETAKNLPVLE